MHEGFFLELTYNKHRNLDSKKLQVYGSFDGGYGATICLL